MLLRDQEVDAALLTLDQAAPFLAEGTLAQTALADLPGGACWLGLHQGIWDILPQDLRKILTDSTGPKLSQDLGRALRAADRAAIDALRGGPGKTHYLSAEERGILHKTAQDTLLKVWQDNARQAGIASPGQLLDRMRRIAADILAGK